MSKKNEYKDDSTEKYALTDKAKDNCLKMVEGSNPSELGYGFIEAAILLSVFRITIDNALKENPPDNQELKANLIELLEKAKDLMKKYMDAARLTGEFPY